MKKTKINPRDRRPIPAPQNGPNDRIQLPPSRMDPDGWYTGLPLDWRDRPVQDQDDL